MNINFKKNTIAAAMLIALAAPAVQAITIEASVTGSVGGVAFTDDIDNTPSFGSVDVLAGVSQDQSSVFYHTYGNESGNFGSRVSGNGKYDLTGIFTYTDVIANNSGIAQNYDFDFTVTAGEISVSGNTTESGEFLHAEYDLDILINGASVWNSDAKLDKNSSGTTFSQNGTPLTSTSQSGDNYSWGSFDGFVNLGTLAAGDSFNFEYRLLSHAAGECTSSANDQNFDGVVAPQLIVGNDAVEFVGNDAVEFVGNDAEEFVGARKDTQCGSIARIGDPFLFNASPLNTTPITSNILISSAVNSVPTPGSIALLGLGLAGLTLTRRKKNK